MSLAATATHLPFTFLSRIGVPSPAGDLAMDLNYIFLRQQVERSFASSARSKAARKAHEEMARAYELAIEHRSGGKIVFSSPQDR